MIEFGHWTQYVVYVSVIVCYCTGGLSGVILSFVYSISNIRTHARVWRLFQYAKEVVAEFLYWIWYVHVHVHVLYVSVIVCYCTDSLSGVILSFMYAISKDLRL